MNPATQMALTRAALSTPVNEQNSSGNTFSGFTDATSYSSTKSGELLHVFDPFVLMLVAVLIIMVFILFYTIKEKKR